MDEEVIWSLYEHQELINQILDKIDELEKRIEKLEKKINNF